MAVGATRFLGDGYSAFALLFASSLAPPRAFANVGEFLKTDQGGRMGGDNGFRDAVISLQFQPSLSSAERDLSPRCRTSAFLLQAFTEPGVVVSFRPDAFAGIEPASVGQGRRRCQVTLPDIYAHNRRECVRGWLRYLQFQGDQKGKLLAGLFLPELGTSHSGTVMDEGHMRLIALVGEDDAPL